MENAHLLASQSHVRPSLGSKLALYGRKARHVVTSVDLVRQWVHGHALPAFEHHRVLRGLDVAHVIDVGANRGQFAKLSRRLWPESKIDCFDPLMSRLADPWKFAGADPGIRQHSYGIGSGNETRLLSVPASDDNASFLEPYFQSVAFSGKTSQIEQSWSCEVRSLDSVFEDIPITDPALLKIDVQGLEVAVLDGASQVLPRITWILIEGSGPELYRGQENVACIASILWSAGFKLLGIDNVLRSKSGLFVQGDFLFANPKRVG